MHILYLTSEYPSPRVSHAAGIGTSIKNLAVTLADKGHKITVVIYHQKEDAVYKEAGVTIHLLKSRHYKYITFYRYRKYIQNYINIIAASENVDIIEAPDWTGITAFMSLKVPLVIRFHGSDAYFCRLDGRKQKFKNYVFEKLAVKKAQAYISPTTFAGEETAKIFGLSRHKIKTIHYGLKLDDFINSDPKEFEFKRLLYIGTIIRKKGVFELAEIFNKVVELYPTATLTLIGSDSPDVKTGTASTYQLIQQIFSETAIEQVTYLGKIPYHEVQSHIKQAHVCAFPSFAETLGMVTIESMALQKPVVNTSIGWAQELIENGVNGYLVHPTDIELYAKRINTLFDDIDLCYNMGKAASEQVNAKFDINKNASLNIDYYKSLLKYD